MLAYIPMSIETKLWLGLLGLALPFGWFGFTRFQKPEENNSEVLVELFPKLSPWFFILVLVLSLVPRFFRLTSLSAWPFPDDGLNSFYPMELLGNGRLHFFYSFSQQPPLYYWGLAGFFKLFPPSLFSIWLYPAVLSTITVFIWCLTVQKWFSKSLAFFCLWLMSFSFWPWYIGRIGASCDLFMVWEVLVFFLLAVTLKSSGYLRKNHRLILLGFVTGLGFLIHLNSILVSASVASALFFHFKEKPLKLNQVLNFIFPWSLFLIFFLAVSLHEKNGQYVEKLWSFRPGMDWVRQMDDFLSDIRAVFWGFDWRLLYGPVWGGMLNPLLGALVFTGILECYRFRSSSFVRWLFLTSVLFLAPIVVAKGFDTFRILQILPLLVLLMAIGLQALLSAMISGKRIVIAALILLPSLGLDYDHLFVQFHRVWGIPGPQWGYQKSQALCKAFTILDVVQKERGPGAVLSNLRTYLVDQTLTLAVFPFDVSRNPSLRFEQAKWVAVILDAHYQSFLAERFPRGKWYWLDSKDPYGGWMLGVIPIESENKTIFQKWLEADRRLQPATSLVLNANLGQSQSAILKSIFSAEDWMKEDRFLQTCFWEKVLTHRTFDHDAGGSLEAIQMGLQKGYPLAEFYNEQGAILTQLGRYSEARVAFEKAAHSKINLTPAAENLKALDLAGR